MKKWKSILSVIFVFALMMNLGFSEKAEASPPYTITINNSNSGHTYEAYQIFKGSTTATNTIEWGTGINSTDFLAALQADSSVGTHYTGASTAADVAEALSKNTGDAETFAKIAGQHLTNATATSTYNAAKYTISIPEEGYYLIKDQDGTSIDAYTNYILQVSEDTVVDPKSDVPTSQKKVKDINDSTDVAMGGWQDSADHDIGDRVPFQLSATLPNNYDSYTTYSMTFHDEQSAGLTFEADSVKAYYMDGNQQYDFTKGTDYTVQTTGLSDSCTFEIEFTNLKTKTGLTAGMDIYVEYESTLNDDAVIGSAGNPNEMYLTYSNNPYGNDTGRTPKDKVIVFTYQTIVNKVDGESNPLEGAEFTLYKFDKSTNDWKATAAATVDQTKTTFTFKGLDDGKYKLSETKTPDGYNTIADIEFEIKASHDVNSPDPKLTSLTGGDLGSGLISFTPNEIQGSLSTNVVNEKGAELPSTGGSGTILLYFVGVLLIAGGIAAAAVRRYYR